MPDAKTSTASEGITSRGYTGWVLLDGYLHAAVPYISAGGDGLSPFLPSLILVSARAVARSPLGRCLLITYHDPGSFRFLRSPAPLSFSPT